MRIGDRSLDVAAWQRELAKGPRPTTWTNDAGVTRSWPSSWAWPLAADGIFGQMTEWATEAWQFARGRIATGIASLEDIPAETDELLRGTDLSAIQGVQSDAMWRRLAEAGHRFTILRLVVGNETWIDGAAKANAERAKAHGIAATGYFFPFPLPHLDPRAQTERFVRALEGLGSNVGDLPPAFDMEWPPPEERDKVTGALINTWAKWGCSPAQLREWCLTALEHGEALTGVRWLVYSYRYWLQRIDAAKAPELGARPLWLADYTHRGRWPNIAEYRALKPPAPWSQIAIVQHDGDGGLTLPDGRDVDCNVALRSTIEDLTQTAREPNVVPEVDPIASRQEIRGAMVEDMIAAYRKERIDTLA